MLSRPLEPISYGAAVSASASARPMDLAPTVDLVPFPAWRRARDQACAVLLRGEKLVVVTGSSGTGKTLLLEDAARILRTAGWRVSFHIPGAKLEGELAGEGGRSVLLLDDADRLSEAELVAASVAEHRPVLLAGSESLAKRCPGGHSIALHALDIDEAKEFIRLWEAKAGIDAPLDAAAAVRLFGVSAGIPRLLAILLNAGLWHRESPVGTPSAAPRTEEAETAPPVAATAPGRTRSPRRRRRVMAGGLLLALLLGGVLAPERYWPAATLPMRTRIWNEALLLSGDVGEKLAPFSEAVSRQLHRSAVQKAEAKSFSEKAPAPRIQAEMPLPPAETPVLSKPAAQAAPAENPPLPAIAPVAPTPEPEKTAATPPPDPVAPPVIVPDQLTPAVVRLLLQRGNESMLLGDYSAARLLFERAVSAGSREALIPLGRTYDRAVLAGYGAKATADSAMAAHYYRQAAAEGVPGAADLLRTVERQASR